MENKELITKAIQYVRNHTENHKLSVQDVADAAGFSLDYFSRLFLSHTGFTVMAYVNYTRLKKAAVLLRTTEKNVLEIALETGYGSHEGFTKAFQKKYGTTPSEYRKQKKNQVIKYSELVDQALITGFIHDNPDFMLVDSDEVIEYLLDTNAPRYAKICGEIKYMGLAIVAQDGDFKKGFMGVGDNRKGGCFFEIVTDDMELLSKWLKRFQNNVSFYSIHDEEYVSEYLCKQEIAVNVKCYPQAVYEGTPPVDSLPEFIQIRELNASDLVYVQKWANGKSNGYIKHLMTPEHYLDESVLEYGIFENEELLAIGGCGIDEVQGLYLNDGCIIRFAEGKEQKNLYRSIYATITEMIWQKGIIPYDDTQFGEYARTHGDFSSTDVGYRIVNRKYDIV